MINLVRLPVTDGPARSCAGGAAALASAAVDAVEWQHATLPAEVLTAQMVRDLAAEVTALNEKIGEIDKLVERRFREHQRAAPIISMSGFGAIAGCRTARGDRGRHSALRHA